MRKLYQQSATALGSDALLTIVTDMGKSGVDELFKELWQKIYDFERRFSRFRRDSELTKLNESAGKEITISQPFRQLLLTAQRFALETGGLFNPFSLPALQRSGYKKSWVASPGTDDPPYYSDRQIVAPDQLSIQGHTAYIPRNSALDLGGCGKGYLLDQLGESLIQKDVTDYWLSLGGDILASGQALHGKPWVVTIAHALQPDKISATVSTPSGRPLAIATSGITKRRGKHLGQEWHHIIDPSTGKPSQTDLLTVSVCNSRAVVADVYASCLVTLGTTLADSFLKDQGVHDALLQTKKGDSIQYGLYGDTIKLA